MKEDTTYKESMQGRIVRSKLTLNHPVTSELNPATSKVEATEKGQNNPSPKEAVPRTM